MNVCTEFQVNPSNGCWDISLKTINVNLMVTLEEDAKVSRIHPLETASVCVKFHINIAVWTKVLDQQHYLCTQSAPNTARLKGPKPLMIS